MLTLSCTNATIYTNSLIRVHGVIACGLHVLTPVTQPDIASQVTA